MLCKRQHSRRLGGWRDHLAPLRSRPPLQNGLQNVLGGGRGHLKELRRFLLRDKRRRGTLSPRKGDHATTGRARSGHYPRKLFHPTRVRRSTGSFIKSRDHTPAIRAGSRHYPRKRSQTAPGEGRMLSARERDHATTGRARSGHYPRKRTDGESGTLTTWKRDHTPAIRARSRHYSGEVFHPPRSHPALPGGILLCHHGLHDVVVRGHRLPPNGS